MPTPFVPLPDLDPSHGPREALAAARDRLDLLRPLAARLAERIAAADAAEFAFLEAADYVTNCAEASRLDTGGVGGPVYAAACEARDRAVGRALDAILAWRETAEATRDVALDADELVALALRATNGRLRAVDRTLVADVRLRRCGARVSDAAAADLARSLGRCSTALAQTARTGARAAIAADLSDGSRRGEIRLAHTVTLVSVRGALAVLDALDDELVVLLARVGQIEDEQERALVDDDEADA
jgi:hypothetical protein